MGRLCSNNSLAICHSCFLAYLGAERLGLVERAGDPFRAVRVVLYAVFGIAGVAGVGTSLMTMGTRALDAYR